MRADGTSVWLKRVALVLLVSAATGSAVRAQPPQRGLEPSLIPGMTVWITNSGGREDKVQIVSVSGDAVTATAAGGVQRLPTADIVRIRVRQSDSLINGALIGAGAAVASGLFLCSLTEPWSNCRDDVGPMVRIGAIGAGIGIDALIRGRRTIYDAAPRSTRLYAVPFAARHARGLQFSLRF
jgi:hypothetical protein